MEICVSIAAKTSEYAVVPIKNQISYVFKYDEKVENLKNGVEKLNDARERVRHLVEEAKRKGEEIEQDVVKWLTVVNEKLTDRAQEGDPIEAKNKCFFGLCPNLRTRYQLTKRAEKDSKAIAELLNEADKFKSGSVSYRRAPSEMMTTYVKGFEAFESRRLVFDGVLGALNDVAVNVIGVYGMGGVGKTTIARQVAGQAKEEKLFESVVMAPVTQNAEVAEIQQEIADRLGLEFSEKTISVRADRLRERLKKEKKVLIVLDDIWESLDLEAVGIPCGGEDVTCKVLLTSRDLNVLSMMDSERNFAVGVLEEVEAWNLFNKIAGDNVVESPDLYSTAIEIAKKCAGLPIAIVTVARALRNKSPFQWRDALQQLRTPSPRNFTGIPAPIYSAIELSYNYLAGEELKSTFLLCSLLCADTPILDLIKYGMGLGLFQGVSTIEEARDRAYSLVHQLKSSGLLIDSFFEDVFSVHDVVRDVALSIASREQLGFSLRNELGPKEWPPMDVLKNCIFMSLSHNHFVELPEELECPQLQFFFICNVFPTLGIRDDFFAGMRKLKVLDLTGLCFSLLPSSVNLLSNLRTLCLDRTIFENITIIKELKTIEILSLRKCDIQDLPREIGQLFRLKLLDLAYNPRLKLIPPGVLSNLSGLEKLSLESSFSEWEVESNASLTELKQLSRLTSLDVHIPNGQIMPTGLFPEKLKRYKIFIGDAWNWSGYNRESSRTLKLKLNSSIQLDEGIKTLLKKTEDLYLDDVRDIKNVLYELDAEGFPQLKYLHVQNNLTIKHIVNSGEWVPCKAFPILESLSLRHMTNLEKIYHGDIVAESFSRLKFIKVSSCDRLNNLFSLSTARSFVQLQEIEVTYCENMAEIIAEEREVDIEENEAMNILEFREVRSLTLVRLSNFTRFCSRKEMLSTSEHGRTQSTLDMRSEEKTLFNKKDMFPNLENLDLQSINVEKIWHGPFPANCSNFRNLTAFSVEGCGNLKCLLSSSMVQSFLQLKMLRITNCEMMEEVIVAEEEKLSKIMFPKLELLSLDDLPKLTRFCSESLIEFSSLTKLSIRNCPCLKMFVLGFASMGMTVKKEARKNKSKENIYVDTPVLFDEKVALPILKRLEIYKMDSLEKIWHEQLPADSFCKLNDFWLDSCDKLLNVFPISMLKRLRSLEILDIKNCDSLEQLFASEGSVAQESCAAIATQSTVVEAITKFVFPQVRVLRLTKLPKLRSFYPRIHSSEWPSLKRMWVTACDKVEIFASEYPSLKEIHGKTQLEIPLKQPLFWVNKVTFPCLEELILNRNEMIKEIWKGQVPAEYFCKLKVLMLSGFPMQSSTSLSRFLSSLKSLENLVIGDASFDKIFQCEGLTGEEKHAWTFHSLAELKLVRLPELMYLWQEGFQPGTMFQNLRTVKVIECDKLKNLAPSSASFQNLSTLEVLKCHGFLNLVTHSTAKILLRLTRMSIKDCTMIETIVACEGGDDIKDGIVFTQLKILKLICLPNLQCFCSGSYPVVFPSLEELIVAQCPEMKIFSNGELSTPKLQKVQVINPEAEGHLEGSHTTTTMQQLFKEQRISRPC